MSEEMTETESAALSYADQMEIGGAGNTYVCVLAGFARRLMSTIERREEELMGILNHHERNWRAIADALPIQCFAGVDVNHNSEEVIRVFGEAKSRINILENAMRNMCPGCDASTVFPCLACQIVPPTPTPQAEKPVKVAEGKCWLRWVEDTSEENPRPCILPLGHKGDCLRIPPCGDKTDTHPSDCVICLRLASQACDHCPQAEKPQREGL